MRLIGRLIGWAIFILAFVFVVWRVLLGHEINTRFAKIHAAGLPVSGEELNHWRPAVPDDKNGALVMNEAFTRLWMFPDKRSNQVESGNYLFRTNIWSEETAKLIEEYVQTNDAASAKAREALKFSAYRYPADYAYGPDTELTHLAKLKTLARVAAFHAVLDAERDRLEDWPQYVEFQLQLAATLDDEPVLISYLVRNAIIDMASKATERCLSCGSPTDEQCRQLQEAFLNAGRTNTLPLALIGERAMMAPVFRLNRSEIENSSQIDGGVASQRWPQHYSGKPVWYLWVSGFFERDLNFYLQSMDLGTTLAAKPISEALTATNIFRNASNVAARKYYMLSSMFLPSLSRVFQRQATAHAQLDLAVTALAVERFKRAHGRLPEDLNELAPDFMEKVPGDPFDGAPLRFHHLTRGYVIYSIGADGHDDGGRERPEKWKSGDTNSYDITFTVETP
jgi:hypothetical protein